MTIYDIPGNVLHISKKRTIKAALAEAVAAKISLRKANLRGVDLRVANLSGADLTGATGIPGVLDWMPGEDDS